MKLRLSELLALVHQGLSDGMERARVESPLLRMQVSKVKLEMPVRITFGRPGTLWVEVPEIPRRAKWPLNLAWMKSKWVL